jgi:hypothetical protein
MSIEHISFFTIDFCDHGIGCRSWVWNPGPPPSSFVVMPLQIPSMDRMDPGSSSSEAALILGTSFLSFPYTIATILHCTGFCLIVSLHSLLSSHDSNDPPLEFVCPFLYILYFPHTIATTLSGICPSASLHFLLSSQNAKKLTRYGWIKKIAVPKAKMFSHLEAKVREGRGIYLMQKAL